MKALVFLAGICVLAFAVTGIYLLVRSFHHQWKWQNKVNENRMRKAMLEEFDIQYEVDNKGFVTPTPRHRRQSE